MGAKWILAGILALAVVTAVTLGYVHYTSLVEDNARLRENNTLLTKAVDDQKKATVAALDAVQEWKKNSDKIIADVGEMVAATKRAGDYMRTINDKFARHDIGALIQARPDALERRINSGTAAAFRMFECAAAYGGQCPVEGGPAPAGAGATGPGGPAPR